MQHTNNRASSQGGVSSAGDFRFGKARATGTFALSVVLMAGLAIAQESKSESPPAKPVQPAKEPTKEPTLDELLGLPDAKPKDAPTKPVPAEGVAPVTPPKDATKAELERALSLAEAKDEFEEAIELMQESAERLTTSGDTGISTQRIQENTLLKLDKLIDQAKKNQQKQKSKSKSKQQKDQQESQSQSLPQSSQSQSQQQQAQQQNASTEGGMPGSNGAGGRLNVPPGAGAAWGNLPERLRDALMQGSGDFTSAKYEALTREYYKRLAEQPPLQPQSPSPSRGDPR